MYSRVVSLKPPFFALVNGVRTARVMTMSSAFLEVLRRRTLATTTRANNLLLGGNGGIHLVERAARRQVLEDGADAFNSHCCGRAMRDGRVKEGVFVRSGQRSC